jgi:transaldolase
MRKAGITDYESFAKEVLQRIADRPISFEVFSDDFREMKRQAEQISSWGKNVYVKIPITNTQSEPSYDLIGRLTKEGVQVNVTALMTIEQVRPLQELLANGPRAYISIFAGRIADTGRDPVPIVDSAVKLLLGLPNVELIWASPRELLNIFQADSVGCHVITVSHELLKKANSIGKDLTEFSLETVKMFYEDANRAGYRLRKADSVVA